MKLKYILLTVVLLLISVKGALATPFSEQYEFFTFDDDVTTGSTTNGSVGILNASFNATSGVSGFEDEAFDFESTSSMNAVVNSSGFDHSDSTNITISAWINPESLPGVNVGSCWPSGTSTRTIMLKGSSSGVVTYGLVLWRDSSGSVQTVSFMRNRDGSATDCVDYQTSLSLDTWVHLAGTYDESTNNATLYLNGTAVASSSLSGAGSGGGIDGFAIGSGSTNNLGVSFFDGEIDAVGVWNSVLTTAEINDTLVNGAVVQYPYSAAAPPSIGTINIGAFNTSGSGFLYPNGESAFNESLIQDIERMRINFTVDDLDGIDTVKIYFTANGTNGCSFGNRQSDTCFSFPNFIEWQNNTVTETFNATTGVVGDNINCTVSGSSTSQTWTCDIDEHYNPNIGVKNYPLDFGNVNWQEGANFRIQENNWWKIAINTSTLPQDADIYKIDFRVSGDNSSSAPTQPIELFLCNSTYSTGDPELNSNCNFVAQKSPTDLQDDGTKFRAVIPNSFVSSLGDISFALIGSDTPDIPAQYYAMKTYAIQGGGTSIVETSSDNAASFATLAGGFETDFNINFFYNGTGSNISEIVFRVWANDTVGNSTNSSFEVMSWNIGELPNEAPQVDIITPIVNQQLNLSFNVNWSTIDANSDTYFTNVTISNSTNTTVFGDNLADSISTLNIDVTNWALGNYDVNVTSCENTTSDLFCGTGVHNVSFGNSAPTASWTNTSPVTVTMTNATLNFTCVDSQTTVTQAYIFINNTNLSAPNVSTTSLGYLFNLSQGSYNISVMCDDGVFNSTTDDLIVSFIQRASPTFVQPAEAVTYYIQGTTLNWQFTSLNTADNCTYRLNDFQNVTLTNCTSGANNITFIDGFNEWRVCHHIAGADECNIVRFWVHKNNRTLADYLPIILWLIIGVIVYILSEFMKIPFLHLISGIYFILFSIYWWGFFTTWYIPVIVTTMGLFLMLRSFLFITD